MAPQDRTSLSDRRIPSLSKHEAARRSMPSRTVGGAAVLAVLLGPALGSAQPPAQPPAPTAEAPATAVSGVTVTLKRPPRVDSVTVTADWCPQPNPARYASASPPTVVDSYPSRDALVSPGVLIIRVSFDQPMACDWAVSSESDSDDPCEPAGAWELPGRNTWRMRCAVKPDTRYRIRFGDVDGKRFVGLSGKTAPRYDMEFTTSAAPPVRSVDEALMQDGRAIPAAEIAGYITCSDRRFGRAEEAPCRHTADYDATAGTVRR